MKKALVIEDDRELNLSVQQLLRNVGLEPDAAHDGEAGLKLFEENEYVLIVFDLNLPRIEGAEICRRIREKDTHVPLIALTSEDEEVTKVLLLELGADDYVTKPFSPKEFKARIRTVLRRTLQTSQSRSSSVFEYKDLRMDLDSRQVTLAGVPIDFTATEFDLLAKLASKPGYVFRRDTLNEELFGYLIAEYDDSLNSRINRIRGKIERDRKNPEFIFTVRGVGYRFGEGSDL